MQATPPNGSTLLIAGLMFVAAGIYLTFFPGLLMSTRSPYVLWPMRFIGLFSLLFGALGLWLATGHTIPSFTG